MNWIKTTVLVMLLALTAASNLALAQHRGPRVGVYIGGPLGWGGYPSYYAPSYYPPFYYAPSYYPPSYYPPSYYYPPVVQSSPPVYVEQAQPPAAAAAPTLGYWYYCRESQGYYPYVKDCPTAWERVAPQPSR